jgi:glycine oxidase
MSSLEPALSEHLKGAMYIPGDGNVSAILFSKALATAAIKLGAHVLEYTEVYDFIKEKNKILGVKTIGGSFYATDTIVAGGAWSEQLVKQVGAELYTYPVKGECFSVRTRVTPIKRTIFSRNCYIVPKPGGRLLIGATEKVHTFDETVSIRGISKLMNLAIQFIPELKNATWEKAWAGIRPQTSDGLPYLGRHPVFQGLSIATGHYRNGILLAPITGWLMAELIEGKNIDPIFEVRRDWIKEEKI